jgi:prenyltransferase beta subunit
MCTIIYILVTKRIKSSNWQFGAIIAIVMLIGAFGEVRHGECHDALVHACLARLRDLLEVFHQ